MSEPFVGEIRMFAGNFAPRGWAFCDGQLLAVNQNDALFSLLGTIYGGDGRTTFGLPDMRGRIPVHAGNGPGLSDRRLGSKSGSETETLTLNQLPSHGHTFNGVSGSSDSAQVASNRTYAASSESLYVPNSAPSQMANVITQAGGNQSHTNMMPSLCVSFIIALFGIYPSRN